MRGVGDVVQQRWTMCVSVCKTSRERKSLEQEAIIDEKINYNKQKVGLNTN